MPILPHPRAVSLIYLPDPLLKCPRRHPYLHDPTGATNVGTDSLDRVWQKPAQDPWPEIYISNNQVLQPKMYLENCTNIIILSKVMPYYIFHIFFCKNSRKRYLLKMYLLDAMTSPKVVRLAGNVEHIVAKYDSFYRRFAH